MKLAPHQVKMARIWPLRRHRHFPFAWVCFFPFFSAIPEDEKASIRATLLHCFEEPAPPVALQLAVLIGKAARWVRDDMKLKHIVAKIDKVKLFPVEYFLWSSNVAVDSNRSSYFDKTLFDLSLELNIPPYPFILSKPLSCGCQSQARSLLAEGKLHFRLLTPERHTRQYSLRQTSDLGPGLSWMKDWKTLW